MNEAESRWMRHSVALYRRLLYLYPPAFRQVYGEHMLQVFHACCRTAVQMTGWRGLLRLWRVTLSDLSCSVPCEHAAILAERGNAMLHLLLATGLRWIVAAGCAWLLASGCFWFFYGILPPVQWLALLCGLVLVVSAYRRTVQDTRRRAMTFWIAGLMFPVTIGLILLLYVPLYLALFADPLPLTFRLNPPPDITVLQHQTIVVCVLQVLALILACAALGASVLEWDRRRMQRARGE